MKTRQALARNTEGYTGVLNYTFYENVVKGWVLKNGEFIDSNTIITAVCAETNTPIDVQINFKPNSKDVQFVFKQIHKNINTIYNVINLKFNNTTIFQIPLKPFQQSKSYLNPTGLACTDVKPKNILLIGPCTIAALRTSLNMKFKDTNFIHYNANNFSKVITNSNKYDVKVITITPYQLLGMLNETLNFLQENFWEEKLEEVKEKLSLMLDNYIDDSGVLTLVCNYITPQAPPEISLQRGREIKRFLLKVNLFLEEYIKKYKNTFILDVENIASSIGKMYCTGEHIHPPMLGKMFYSDGLRGQDRYPEWKAPERDRIDDYICVDALYENKLDDYYQAIYREIESLYRISLQIDQIKMVVFDLDDTLIAGRIVDHYEMSTTNTIPKRCSWNAGLWQAVQYLRGRGILISIISKNDEKTVKKWFSKISHSNIKFEDFTNVKINWKPKNENMAELLQETKLTSKSVVFVDDNPVERDNIKTYFPEIRVIGSSPYELKRLLCWSPESQITQLSQEALNKKELIDKVVQINKELKNTNVSREQFLLNLQLEIDIKELQHTSEEDIIARCFELTNKTNQFNTTGVRWNNTDFFNFIKRPKNKVFFFNVKDKNTNHGIVGVVYTEENCILQFLMSCRVIGLDVEKYVLTYIENILFKTYKNITAIMVETPNNLPCREVYTNNNYLEEENGKFIKYLDK